MNRACPCAACSVTGFVPPFHTPTHRERSELTRSGVPKFDVNVARPSGAEIRNVFGGRLPQLDGADESLASVGVPGGLQTD